MKSLFLLIAILITSLTANTIPIKNKEDKSSMNLCKNNDSNVCNELGSYYLNNTDEKKKNIFLGLLFHNKACKLENKESCNILSEYKNKELYSLFNDKEKKIFEFFVKDEISYLLKNKTDNNFFEEYYKSKKEYISVTSNEIQLDYEKNEVGADLKYKDKDIIVSGQVLKISKDAFNSIYLDLKGGTNQFMPPKAYIKNDYIEWASKLSKNDNVNIYCEKSSMIIGSAIVHNCVPLEAVVNERANVIIDNINKNELNKLNEWTFISYVVVEVGKSLKNNSSCYSLNEMNKCKNEIESITTKANKDTKKMIEVLKQ